MHPIQWLHSHATSLQHSQHWGHLVYFAAVVLDGHGAYAMAAAGMLTLGILVLLAGEVV